MPVNVWSGCDYTNGLNGFIRNFNSEILVEVSNQYSSNGDYSLKLVKSEPYEKYYFMWYEYNVQVNDIGKTATFKVDVFNTTPNESVRVVLGMDFAVYTVLSPYTGKKETVEISHNISESVNVVSIYISFIPSQSIVYYADNFSLTLS